MKLKAKKSTFRVYYWLIGICVLLLMCIELLKIKPDWVEKYYTQSFYPALSYVYIILFSWIPLSIGDILYGLLVIGILWLLIRFFQSIFNRNWFETKKRILQIITLLLGIYTLFYINWGLNYYRQPIARHFQIDLKSTTKEDYYEVLKHYILKANELREKVNITEKSKLGVQGDLNELVRQDTIFDDILIKTQIHSKSPLSSKLISYFTVSGYFNPFTLEAHINQEIPNAGYPFTHVHELAHQQGVGFEDECNFIAFIQLKDNKDLWYQYSAYYAAIQYLFQPLFADKENLEKYKSMLSSQVKQDLQNEREFWQSYRGWLDRISGIFYDQYLKHNNQPEGLDRYNMMTQLVVAWEKQYGILSK